jgi:hypothetical protein
MIFRKPQFLILSGLSVLVMAGLFLLWPASKASAQCGSQASSCKNCHETQGQDPVNSDGTAWHVSHAFGDFCYICHAGNNQSMDKAIAHTGMVAPMSDVKAACQSCHPNDLQQRAEVYATKLGVTVDTASSGAAPTVAAGTTITQTTTTGPAVSQTGSGALTTAEQVVDDPNLVNYTQRYNEIVLGQHPINWGNVILMGMIGIVLVGGGAFVIANEKLVKVSFGDTKQVEGEYPSDVVDMLPAIAGLKPQTRKSLKSILDNPKKTAKVLGLIDEVVSDKKTEE